MEGRNRNGPELKCMIIGTFPPINKDGDIAKVSAHSLEISGSWATAFTQVILHNLTKTDRTLTHGTLRKSMLTPKAGSSSGIFLLPVVKAIKYCPLPELFAYFHHRVARHDEYLIHGISEHTAGVTNVHSSF